MIIYNPKDWLKLIFQFHKSDTIRRLFPVLLFIGVYAWIVVYAELHFLNIKSKNPTVMHSILGFVLSMLLVFRTNSAYDRWWEGRKLWGSFVNNTRNLSLKLASLVKDQHEKHEFRLLITNYVYATKNHLREKFVPNEFEVTSYLSHAIITDAVHKPNSIAKVIYEKIFKMNSEGKISDMQLNMLNEEIKSLTDNCGACERIRSTPIPYSYNIFLKKIIFIYIISLPVFFGVEFGYSTVPITVIVLYVFASIELIAEEIEDPFGEDDNDLPLDNICGIIKANLHEIMK
jgi:putative membrane protein